MGITTSGTKYYYIFHGNIPTFVQGLDICNQLYLKHQQFLDSFLFDRGIGLSPTVSHEPGPIGIAVAIDVQVDKEVREQFLMDISVDIHRALEIYQLNYGED